MSPIAPALNWLSVEIGRLSSALDREVRVAAIGGTDRRGDLPLAKPGLFSANRSCGLVRAEDGWLALNLARPADRELIPAWLGCDAERASWAGIRQLARGRGAAELLQTAIMLGLPAARVGETSGGSLVPLMRRMVPAGAGSRPGQLRVVDLSSLWAGPLCGAILAEMGAEVIRIECVRRPDPTRTAMPGFHHRLNGRKIDRRLDLRSAAGRARLREAVFAADVLITSARLRAFADLELTPEAVFAANPSIVWVAITGHGFTGDAGHRVGFGDDAAAAGGLVRWTIDGEPRFQGDALADPLTGLAAAAGALQAVAAGGGLLVDAAMARAASAAAAMAPGRLAA